MNDPNDPSADERAHELLDGIAEGDPFAVAVEDLLADGGPVPIDETDLEHAVASLQSRFAASATAPTPHGVPRWVRALAMAAALTLVGGVSWLAGKNSVTASPTASTPAASSDEADPRWGDTQVSLRDGSIAEWSEDTVVLVDGVVSIARSDPRQVGPHRVRVSALDLTVDPVGTVYFVGSHEDLAAIWVREGRVTLMHDNQGHLGEVGAGSWALVNRSSAGLQVHRMPDGPFEARAAGLGEGASELLAQMRWMALPEGARTAILQASDGP